MLTEINILFSKLFHAVFTKQIKKLRKEFLKLFPQRKYILKIT